MGQWIDFQRLKAEVSMRDVLGHYEEVHEKGREFLGHCPFHDKGRYYRGAFSASTTKNVWKCFICNRGGNVLDFVMAMEGISIREAGVKLAEWTQGASAEAKGTRPRREREESKTAESG